MVDHFAHPSVTPCWNALVAVLLYDQRHSSAAPYLDGNAWQMRRTAVGAAIVTMAESYGLQGEFMDGDRLHLRTLLTVIEIFRESGEDPTVLSDRILAMIKLLSPEVT